MQLKIKLLQVILAFCLGVITSGCETLDPESEVPSYIHIDSIKLEDGPNNQSGTISHNIQDAWVISGGQFIGTFELPATIPILQEGRKEIVIRSGIENNGISNTRTAYPFYDTIRVERNLERKKVDSLGVLSTSYLELAQFEWIERFEDTTNITLRNNDNANVPFQLTSKPEEVFDGNYSLKAEFEEKGDFFEVKLPQRKAVSFKEDLNDLFLEVNFNTEIQIQVGIIAIAQNGNTTQRSKVVLNRTNGKWKKIYINLVRNIQRFPDNHFFQIYFGKVQRSDRSATTYLDNLKLISR